MFFWDNFYKNFFIQIMVFKELKKYNPLEWNQIVDLSNQNFEIDKSIKFKN